MRHFFPKHPFSPVLLWGFVFLFVCCKPPDNISPEAESYLKEVLALLQAKSVNRQNINWADFEQEVFRVAENSQTINDVYPAVRYAVAQLKDNHSYFVNPAGEEENSEEKPLPILAHEKTPGNIGYVRIPFCIGDEYQTEQYIQSVTDEIYRHNNSEINGWIIDLRDNFGGNMWPMMAAVGDFLDNGIQGYFSYADNKTLAWRFENGKAYFDTIMLAENKRHISLSGKNKIAVFINSKTASSGEAMAVLFKGYSNVKLFGAPTFGVSTGCESFTLSDGSRINLATSVFTDKNGKKYGKSILPDFPCADTEMVSIAIQWINNQRNSR